MCAHEVHSESPVNWVNGAVVQNRRVGSSVYSQQGYLNMGMSTGQRDCQGLLHGLGFRTIFESVILSRKVVLSKNTEMAVPGNAGRVGTSLRYRH